VFRHLLESAPKRHRARSAAVLSLAFHAALVGSALAATAIDPREDPAKPNSTTVIVFPPTRPAPTRPARPAPPKTSPSAPSPVSPIIVPTEVPDALPPVPDPGTSPMDPWTTLPTSPATPGGTGDPSAPAGPEGDGSPMWPEDVAHPAKPLGTMREPRYPDPLRTSRLEGTVIATYVVDTLGRVEPASFKAREATHPLFEQAVRTAVMQQRFRAAEWNGKRVRQLVEQQFVFRLNR
jgi:TonB family protein